MDYAPMEPPATATPPGWPRTPNARRTNYTPRNNRHDPDRALRDLRHTAYPTAAGRTCSVTRSAHA